MPVSRAPAGRRACVRLATRSADLPLWAASLATVRGRCRRRGCGGRWAVYRVSLDFRDPTRVDRIATLECAACGRTWQRVRVPELRTADGLQRVRLSLILPGGHVIRWHSRGTWHREGDDAQLLRNADLGDLDEAARAHRARTAARLRARAVATERKATAEAEATERMRDLLARIAAREAEARTLEAAAAARGAA